MSIFQQYGYHGFGNPDDENGIVVFSPERIVLEDIVFRILESGNFDFTKEHSIDFKIEVVHKHFSLEVKHARTTY